MTGKMRKASACLLSLLLLMSTLVSAGAEDLVRVILTAGTTQAFTDEPVSEDDVNTILRAGLQAASAINQQPWFFVALTDQAIMAQINAGSGMPAGALPAGAGIPAEGGEAPSGMPMEGAAPSDGAPAPAAASGARASLGDSPLAILIYKDSATKSPNADFDCGLACQNMVIAANALGYGTKIVSSTANALNGENHASLCELLGVDPAMSAVAVLLIGRTDDTADGASGASVRSELDAKVSFVR